MPTEPLTGARIPASTNSPNVPQDLQNAVYDLAVNGCPRFATVTARDTAYAAYIAAGGTLANGRRCFTDDAGFFERLAGAWVTVKSTGLLTATTGWSTGYGSYYAAGYHLSSNGKVTLRGMFQRTGGNLVLDQAGVGPQTFATLPSAINPASDIAPLAYFGSASSPVQTVTGRLYSAGGSANLQITPINSGSYTIFTTQGFVNLDGVSWYL